MKVLCCFLVALLVLVDGFYIHHGVARKLPNVAWESPTVGRKSSPTVGRKSSPTALHVISIDAGSDSNNTSSWTSMAGGHGDPVTRVDYLVNNAEVRLRGEQGTALTNIQTSIANIETSIATLSNSISTVGKQITDLDTKVGKQITALDTKVGKQITALDTKIDKQITALGTKIDINTYIQIVVFLVISIILARWK